MSFEMVQACETRFPPYDSFPDVLHKRSITFYVELDKTVNGQHHNEIGILLRMVESGYLKPKRKLPE